MLGGQERGAFLSPTPHPVLVTQGWEVGVLRGEAARQQEGGEEESLERGEQGPGTWEEGVS